MRRAAPVAALVVAGPVLGVLVWAMLRLASIDSRPGYLIGAGVAALAVLWVLRMSRSPVASAVALVDDQADPQRRGVTELVTLEHRLAWGSVDTERFESRVRPLLVDVATERLRLRHGLDPVRDPERARPIVGDRLWHLMTGPADPLGRPPSQLELRRILDSIERI